MDGINYFSFLVTALIPIIIGFVYYQKMIFGEIWYDTISMPKDQRIQLHKGYAFCISFLVCLCITIFLFFNCNAVGQEGAHDTFKHGAFHGLGLAILIVIPISITGVLYNERSWKNMFVNAGYRLTSLTLMGGIIDYMNHL